MHVCNTRYEILRHRLLVLWISVQNKFWSSLMEVLLTTLVILYRQGSSERRVYELCTITAMFLLSLLCAFIRSADQLGTLLAAVQDMWLSKLALFS